MNDRMPTSLTSSTAHQDETAVDHALDAAIGQALDRQPAPRIPVDFAARVAQRVAAEPAPRRARWVGWGPRLTVGSAALLTAGMFALAPHAAPSLHNLAFDAELVLLTELSVLLLFSHRLLFRD